MAQLYGKKTSDGQPKALECSDDGALKYITEIKTAAEALAACIAAGKLQVDTEINATLDPSGLATQVTAAAILAAVEGASLAGCDTPGLSGQKTVTTAGTAVAVGGDVDTKGLVIIADPDNGGNIYVGNSDVDNSGCKLPPGGILPAGNVNLTDIYIDADIDGEGISYYYTI